MQGNFEDLEKRWTGALTEILDAYRKDFHEELPKNLAYAVEYASIWKSSSNFLKPKLVVVNGPAGAGKTTVGKMLESFGLERIPRLTDRPQRPGEVSGKDYHFVASRAFDELAEQGKILAAKTTYGSRRGFLKENFLGLVRNSPVVYYAEGESSLRAFEEAQSVSSLSQNLVLNIFLLPPSFQELYDRLVRQSEKGYFTEEELATRLTEGINYLSKSFAHTQNFPHSLFLVNDDVNRIASILRLFTPSADNVKGDHVVPVLDKDHALQNVAAQRYAHENGLIHPIAVVYLFDTQGRFLIQRRSNSRVWDHSAAGHLFVGETYKAAAQRELQEELGIQGASLRFAGSGVITHPLTPKTKRHVFQLFFCFCDETPSIESEEVLETKFVTLEGLGRNLRETPAEFSGGLHATFAHYQRFLQSKDN